MLTHSLANHGRSRVMPVQESPGELAARFERDVMPLRNQLHGVAIRLTRNMQDAEDLVQDTILHAYAGFRTFHEGTNLVAWLHRIMHNIWINHWRKKQRRCAEVSVGRITDDQLSEFFARGANDFCSAEVAALESEPDIEVKAALMALHATFRVTVYYADVEGFSTREIADMMNTPVGTVMSRLHRSRRRLRTSLRSVANQHGYSPTSTRDDPSGAVQ